MDDVIAKGMTDGGWSEDEILRAAEAVKAKRREDVQRQMVVATLLSMRDEAVVLRGKGAVALSVEETDAVVEIVARMRGLDLDAESEALLKSVTDAIKRYGVISDD